MNSSLPGLESRPDSLSEQVYNAIREAVVGKTLRPGSTVTEAQLAKELGVSKTPVREALLRLREIGLVQPLATRGVKVIEPTREGIIRAYEVRWALEAATAQLAALRADQEQCTELDDAAARSLEAARRYDPPAFSHWDRQFHRCLWKASGNTELERLAENAYALTTALRAMDAPIGGDSISCAEQHVVIAAAIRDRDEKAAHDVAAQHVQDVLRYVLPPIEPSVAHHGFTSSPSQLGTELP
ncbi:MAG TPA: GntR family transcriptional regulator [Micromonospora sp.]|nr:GntR family transcriptional regulator [Micromonospora sp.]